MNELFPDGYIKPIIVTSKRSLLLEAKLQKKHIFFRNQRTYHTTSSKKALYTLLLATPNYSQMTRYTLVLIAFHLTRSQLKHTRRGGRDQLILRCCLRESSSCQSNNWWERFFVASDSHRSLVEIYSSSRLRSCDQVDSQRLLMLRLSCHNESTKRKMWALTIWVISSYL